MPCRTAARWDSDLRATPPITSACDEGQTSCTPCEHCSAAGNVNGSARAAAEAAEAAAAAVFQLRMRDAVVLARQCIALGVTPSDLHFLMPATQPDRADCPDAVSQQPRTLAEPCEPHGASACNELLPITAGTEQPQSGPPMVGSMAQPDALPSAAVDPRHAPPTCEQQQAPADVTPGIRQRHHAVAPRGAQTAADEHLTPLPRLSRADGRRRGQQGGADRVESGGLTQPVDDRATMPTAQRPPGAARQSGKRLSAGTFIGRTLNGAFGASSAMQRAFNTGNETADEAPAQHLNRRPGSAASTVSPSHGTDAGGSWVADLHVTVNLPACYGSPYPCTAEVARGTDAAPSSKHQRSGYRPAVSAHRQTSVGSHFGGAHRSGSITPNPNPSCSGEPAPPLRRWMTQTPAEATRPHTAEPLSARDGRLILDGLHAVLQRLDGDGASARSVARMTSAAVLERSGLSMRHTGDRDAVISRSTTAWRRTSAAAPASHVRQLQMRSGSAPSIRSHKAIAILRSESKHAARERPQAVSATASRRRGSHDATSVQSCLHAGPRCAARLRVRCQYIHLLQHGAG